MKKILYSVFMVATMLLAACSSEATTEPDVKRGMVLKANVEDTNTRATITDTEGTWKFAFATGDVVKVGNDKVESYYTFTNGETQFASTDAMQTTAAANWYAYFPGETIDLANQSGDFAAIANKYALAGMTASATTGSDGLTVTMKAKAAVLCIVGVKKGESLDINVKTAEGKYVSGLAAVKNSADFSVQESDTKVSLLSKNDAGVYYVVVPADVKLAVYNGSKLMKSTKKAGLTAGKYYTLKTGETTGKAFATINGVEKEKEWVQLWPGGPKFATENVAEKINFTEACKTGEAYVWGKNWRTPTKDEMTFIDAIHDEDGNLKITPLNTKAEVQVQNGVPGILYTGIQPGYTDKTLFLPAVEKDKWGDYYVAYLTSTIINQGWGLSLDFSISGTLLKLYYLTNYAYTTETTKYWVRPVLAEYPIHITV